jgi:very-short-patch-repair endonuclease
MTLLLVVVVVALIAVSVLSFLAKKQSRADEGEWPYYAKKPLSAVEQVLYFRLVQALPDKIVLSQVGLSRLLGVKKGPKSIAWFNKISAMSADFVICAKDSSILAVIELDDATHSRTGRQETDAKKDRALAAAGVRVTRLQVNALPDEAAIKAMVAASPTAAGKAGAFAERQESK